MGPTASGKSALGVCLAQSLGGVILNADAMQVYKELQIITARPTEAEMQDVPHRLYGVLSAAQRCSAARWAALAEAEIKDAWAQGKQPILLGGTGLYIRTLMEGIADIPDPSEEVRARVAGWWEESAPGAFHAKLAEVDAEIAARLEPGDKQRLMRAMEVWEETGTPLSEWQQQAAKPVFPEAKWQVHYIDIPRDVVYARINSRFEQMMQQGALEEVRALMELNLPAYLPAMRAHGVPALMAHLRGEISLEEAIHIGQRDTRHYAKRQMTWIRNQLPQALPVSYNYAQNAAEAHEWAEALRKSG